MNQKIVQRQSAAIQRALAVMAATGQVIEVRMVNVDGRKQRVDSGYFDDFEQVARVITAYTRRAEGIYMTLNPINPALLARAANRIKPWSNLTTADVDITHRCWLPIDIDPVRPSGISSTHEEHEAAHDKALTIQNALADYGWPTPVYADSGNGAHLLYKIDLPNDEGSTRLLQCCLQALADQHDDEMVKIDVGNYNAGRIWKLYYTLAAKGDSTADRPHRWSQIIAAESPTTIVPETHLARLAALAPVPPQAEAAPITSAFNVDAWLAQHGIKADKSAWQGGWRWKLAHCPFNDVHRDGAFIVQFQNGAIGAGCHHNTCQGKTWRDLRARYPSPQSRLQGQQHDTQLQHLIRAELAVALRDFLQELKAELTTGLPSIPAHPVKTPAAK